MKVSVVVVNFNGEAYIQECLDSVLKSNTVKEVTNLFFEVVVVENGSTDGSLKLLKRLYGQNKQVRLVESQTNLFFAGGSNLGARESKGEWVIFLNSDTMVERKWLKELWRQAEGNNKLMLQPKILTYKTKTIDCVVGKYFWPGFGVAVGRGYDDNYQDLVWGDYANGTCLMVSKDWFFKLGGFDELFKFFYEDVDLQLRARRMGGSAVGVMSSVIEHKGSLSFKQNVASDEVLYYYRRNRLLTIIKNFRGIERVMRLGVVLGIYLVGGRWSVSFRAVREGINEAMKYWFNQVRIKEVREIKKGKINWLDLGCGDGELVQSLKEQGVEALGVDKKYGQLIENYKVPYLVKVISMYHVLEHLDKPVEVLKQASEWLKPGGILVVEVPLVDNLSARFLGENYLAYEDKTHKYFVTQPMFGGWIKQADLKIIGQGRTWHQLPFQVITASFRTSFGKGLVGLVLWLPLKLLSIIGLNNEMMRVYLMRMRV